MGDDNDDIIRILVSSDIHLGFGEKLPIRGDDSFVAFDELLGIGREQGVDVCILGGDLFHDNKPSRSAQIKCISILGKHVMGDAPVMLQYLSEPSVDFSHCQTKSVNYEDPNLNVALPIFSIHGNHDDPSGLGGQSCLDLLHESRHINYFGKVDSLKQITVNPILLKKGNVWLALYGLSSVKDERLHRLLREDKVVFEAPDDKDKWFYILVIHQNRAKRGPTNYIPESFLPDFFHLVIWGHEHDCRIEPEPSEKDFFICQPGSTVATSLCEGESLPKKVAILEINSDNKFRIDPIQLRSVRPMMFKSMNITDLKKVDFDEKDDKKLQKMIEVQLNHEVEQLILDSEKQLTGHPKQGKLPLIRLRVEFTDERQQLNTIRFGNGFIDRVANPGDILLFKRRAADRVIKDGDEGPDVLLGLDTGKSMEDYIKLYFKEKDSDKMSILSVTGLTAAVENYIQKSDSEAVEYNVKKQLARRQARLKDTETMNDLEEERDISAAIEELQSRLDEEKEGELAKQEFEDASRKITKAPERNEEENEDSFDVSSDDMEETVRSKAVAKGGPGSRGSRGGRGTRGGGRGKEGPVSTGRGRGKTEARGGMKQTTLSFGSSQSQYSKQPAAQTQETKKPEPRSSRGNRKQMLEDSDSDLE